MAGAPLEYTLVEIAGGRIAANPDLDWQALDRRAFGYRLHPLLHRLHEDSALVPADIRAGWAQSYRAAAIDALHHRRELVRIADLLARQGLPFLALKGASLAWQVWPDPAQRPLRDLDLYLPGDASLAAYGIFVAEGWQLDEPDAFGPLSPGEWLARFKALPALVSPGGIALDLHARLWDEDGRTPPQPEALFDRTVADPEYPAIRYPGPVDQLMHLAVHACFHRFDGGPLMLADFGHLLVAHRFDLPAVWRRADTEGWHAHIALCLAGARRWSGVAAPWPELAVHPPEDVVEDLPLLLAKPLGAREDDIAAAKSGGGAGRLGQRLGKVLSRRERFETLGAYLRWVASESLGSLRSSLGAKERMAAITALDDWLKP